MYKKDGCETEWSRYTKQSKEASLDDMPCFVKCTFGDCWKLCKGTCTDDAQNVAQNVKQVLISSMIMIGTLRGKSCKNLPTSGRAGTHRWAIRVAIALLS